MCKYALILPMKRRLFVLMMILTLFAGRRSTRNPRKKFNLKKYIKENLHNCFKKRTISERQKIINRYAYVISANARRYDTLSERLIAKIIKRESGFRWWVTNKRKTRHTRAVGCMQVIIGLWENKLHSVLEKRHKIKILESSNAYNLYKKYAKQIGYSVSLGCSILDYYISKHGSSSLGVMAYHRGDNSAKFKKAKKDFWILKSDSYVAEVMS